MVYLAVTAIAGGVFVFCSFWVYHFVDLEHDTNQLAEAEAEAEDAEVAEASMEAEMLPPSRGLERGSRMNHDYHTSGN